MGNTLLVTYIIQPHTFCTADSPKMLVFRWLNFITLFILVFSENVCTTLFMLVFSKNICLWHYWVGSDVLFFPFLLQVIIMHRVRRTMNFDNQHTYPSFVTISSTESGLMTAHSSYIHLHTYSYVLLCAISQGKSLRRFRFRRANEMSRVLQFLN